MDYDIPDKVFKTIADLDDIDALEALKRKYRNARYAPDARLAIDDRIHYLRINASNQ